MTVLLNGDEVCFLVFLYGFLEGLNQSLAKICLVLICRTQKEAVLFYAGRSRMLTFAKIRKKSPVILLLLEISLQIYLEHHLLVKTYSVI